MHNKFSEETITMSESSNPLFSKYPLSEPKWSYLNMLTKEATKIYHQEWKSSISCIKIKFHLPPKKTVKYDDNDVLKEDGFPNEEASKKAINLATKKPINFMGSAIEGASSRKKDISKAESNLKGDDHVLKMKKKTSFKRKHAASFIKDEENIHVLDQEWVPDESFKKKQKNSKGCGSTKRQHPKQLSKDVADTIPPDLPQEIKNKISEMGGIEITLVIHKSLYVTDLNPQHNRLSMPVKQIKNLGFLREGELQVLEKKQAIEVPLIQPSLELRNATLAKWDMAKISGPTNSCYVLRSSWRKVVAANQLKPDDVVQVWSFRVQEELHLALVKL